MVSEAQKQLLKDYARRVRAALQAHPQNTEPGLAPEFHRLIVELLPTLDAAPRLTVVPEFRNPGIGRPDIALIAQGRPARSFIELKSIDKPTDGTRWRDPHDKKQFERFGELALWATCNFHEVRLYERNCAVANAILVPEGALDPDRDDRTADRLFARHDPEPAFRIIERLALAPSPSAEDAEGLAEMLAWSARLVRGIVKDRLAELAASGITGAPLQIVRKEFRDVLYSHPEAAGYASSDFDELFSAAFAQTLAFGLLLVREASGEPVDRHAFEKMPDEHPLMRTALRVLSQDEVVSDIGAGFEVMLDTVNGFEPAMLAVREDGYDPILYFYEFFLETFDPVAREKFGVYYTPVEVVRYMVGALDRVLRDDLDTDGLGDERVHILDPATGTGTYLLGVAERVRRDAAARHGAGQDRLALQGLLRRLYGFELLVGPYAVAHYRLHHAFSGAGRKTKAPSRRGTATLPRVGVYLTDTLAEPGTAAPEGALGFVSRDIRDERLESNRIKNEQPILAIIGNPPYRRLEQGENRTLVGNWMDGVWDDLKEPVRQARQGNQLNTFPELSVAFWRWAIWKLFEAPNAPQRGVIAFISNRKYLTGWPYAGLRKMLRERFDRIEIIDLRGDVRLGARAGVENDEGVFNIKVGTAITLAVADGSKAADALAEVTYNDTWANNLQRREDKLEWLDAGAENGRRDGGIVVKRGALEDMRPLPFLNGKLINLESCFVLKSSGIQSKRDHVVYGVSESDLEKRLSRIMSAREIERDDWFNSTSMNPAYNAQAAGVDSRLFHKVIYRPFDVRNHYNSSRWNDRLRPDLQRAWGSQNCGLYALPSGTSEGPAVWCHGLLPDYHAFRGSYGGYAFPLYDRRAGKAPYNLRAELVEALSDAYAEAVAPEAVFDAILCLLSARSYTTRFAEDLEDVFPHVPFPARLQVFRDAARIGAEIRAVETFARPPAERFLRGVARAASAPTGPVGPIPNTLTDGAFNLCADGSGRIENIPEEVWSFAVSGYRVLPRWLSAREGTEIGADFIPQLRDVAGRIAELLFLFAEADAILEQTLAASLLRSALDLGESAETDTDDGTD